MVLRVNKGVEAKTTNDPPEQLPELHAVAQPLILTESPRVASEVSSVAEAVGVSTI
jgi:hypothetical protein